MNRTRRTVGAVAALATVLGGGSLLAVAAPSSAGTEDDLRPASEVLDLLHSSTGAVSGVVPRDGLPLSLSDLGLPDLSEVTGALLPTQAAQSYVDTYATKFGVQSRNLRKTGSVQVGEGEAVKYQQYLGGLPVVAGELVASVTEAGKLQSLYGETAKGTLEMPADLIGQSEAAKVARDYVENKTGVSADVLDADSAGRWVYNPELLNAQGLQVNREVYKFAVTNRPEMVDYTVLVDRGFGTVSLGFDNKHAALNREVCDTNNEPVASTEDIRCDGETLSYERTEGDGESGIADVDAAYDKLGETAHWYASYVDLDVTELIGPKSSGDKRALRATTRACAQDQQEECPMPNAFWSPDLKQMYFGDGWVTSDVMAHELTHGVTSNTSNLYYIYQSGAINESQSDVFGEIVDLAANPEKRGTEDAWQVGDDIENPGPFDTPLRSMSDPPSAPGGAQPDRMGSDLYEDDPEFRDQGGVHTNSGIGNKAAYLIAEGGDFNGYSVEGIGLAKTFKIYWTSQNLLTSGSDYKDLFHVLPLSCRKNIGKEGTFVTESDCEQVDAAVRATEMYEDAAKAAPVATPYCEDGEVDASYSIKWDKGLGDWAPDGGVGRMKRDLGVDYVNSGKDSLGLFSQSGGPTSSSAKSSAKTIPENSMLRIDYSTTFGLGGPTDGAKFALAYNDGSGWKGAKNLSGENQGPWTSNSLGWSSAKYDLSGLAGKDVKFRFTVDGELGPQNAALAGVDNFKIYTCG